MVIDKVPRATVAAEFARRGIAVFPCHYILPNGRCSCKRGSACEHPGKHPATRNGFKDASTDPATVEKMFSGGKPWNIAMATGPASGIWALDADGVEGLARLDDLQREHGPIPETVTVKTPRPDGGRHFWFKYNGREIKSANKINGDSIDIRGTGGYILLPPSNHVHGTYSAERTLNSTPLAIAPDWLADYATGYSGTASQDSLHSSPGLSFTVGGGAVEDLAIAAGAGKGQRHETAKRLIGSALGRGLDPCLVAQQAIDWARRCSPPMDQDDVLRLVSDLSRKEGVKVEAIRDEVEAAPLPEPAAWPTLDDDAYLGLAGEIVKAIEPQSEADPVAILAQLLASVGNLVGSAAYYSVEGTSHHCNLFAVLVGSTARGRKGTSEGRVRQILKAVDEPWTLDNIKTGLVSGEGLIWSVRDPIFKTAEIKEKGRIVGTEQVLADPGIDDKRLLVVESEFAAVLRVCRRETNTLSPTLRSAWDSGILRTLAKNSPAKATGAHISIIGHITQEELRRALCECDGFNGFANRFLWLAVKRSKLLPDGGLDLDLDQHAGRLALAVAKARTVGRLRRDQGAAALWRRAYVELADDDATGLLAAVTSRAEAQVLRLSMIYALLDGSGTIKERHLRAALAIWRYCRESARLIFGNAGGDPLAEKVLETIRRYPAGIGRWELHSSTCKHKPAAALVEVLSRLRDSGKVEARTVTTGGRSAETWFPTDRGREERELREGRVVESGGLTSDSSLTSHTSLTSQGQQPEMEVFTI